MVSSEGNAGYYADPQQTGNSMLAPYRVLDLADEKGFLCGRLLGDLGADVIKIEPPGGDPARRIAPFYKDVNDPEKSLYWFAYNANKRGITLDITGKVGKDLFRNLVKKSHFVIESFDPGYMDYIGLGYDELSQINSSVVVVSITPFGQTGPYRDYRGPDLVNMAMGGFMYLCGDPDRAPVRVSFAQSYLLAGAQAFAAALTAHYYRLISGEGQHADVSIQQSVYWPCDDAPLYWSSDHKVWMRQGPVRRRPTTGVTFPVIWQCKDGYVAFLILGGKIGAPTMRSLVAWMDKEGIATEALKEMRWEELDWSSLTQEAIDAAIEPMARFFLARTKAELWDEAVRRGMIIYPVSTAEDICSSEQLLARNYWVELEHPELGGALTYPGAWVQTTEAPLKLRRRAPLIGEHNQEVYRHLLRLSEEKLTGLSRSGVV